jgi:hypothetical protein
VKQGAARGTSLSRIIRRSLKQKAAEEQDAEDDYNRDNDEFDQRHGMPQNWRKCI